MTRLSTSKVVRAVIIPKTKSSVAYPGTQVSVDKDVAWIRCAIFGIFGPFMCDSLVDGLDKNHEELGQLLTLLCSCTGM